MKLAAVAGLLALLFGALVLIVQPFASSPPGSTPERTAYSAVYAIKHLNFGRFCSYLGPDLRGKPDECRYNNAAGWGANAMFFGIDTFADAKIVPSYRVDVDEDTVKFVVQLPAIQAYYWFIVERQPSGKWRITDIHKVQSLVKAAREAKASHG